MNYTSHNYVINHFNLVLGKNLPQATLRFSKKNFQLIYLLYKIGCINNFVIFKTKNPKIIKYITFSVFFYKNSPFFKQIKLISSFSKKHTITYKALKLINKSLGTSFLLLSTTRGLILHTEALQYKIGGLMIAVLN